MQCRTTVKLAMVYLLLAHFGVTFAQQPSATASREAAIRQAGASYVKALRSRNAEAAAAAWTENGTYTDVAGNSFNARQLINERFKQQGVNQGADDAPISIDSKIRFVTEQVAIESGRHSSDTRAGRFTATWVNVNGRWLLDHLVDHAAASSAGGRLASLAWMIGDWAGQTGDVTIRWSATWSENNMFIVRRFSAERPGKPALTGEQRIGWHPGSKSIRSWGFDSSGGITESRWSKEDDAWIVRNSGFTGSGESTTSVSFWLPEGNNRCAYKTGHIKAGDVDLEDVIVEFNRVN